MDMFPGTSSAAVGDPGSSNSNPQDIHSDIAASLFALSPHPNNYMVRFLSDASGEQSPILGEYFGVALAFAALGALVRESKVTPEAKLSPKLQRLDLQVMLKNAMDRLQALASNAQDLEWKVKDGKEVTRRDVEALEAERQTLVQKLSATETIIASAERTRQEDAKANERVARLFVSYEQICKDKKLKLKREVELLRDEIGALRNRNSQQKDDEEKECEGCEAKARELEKLQGQLCEKEFLMASAMEEARADQLERNQLAGKLKTLSKEMARNADLQEALANVRRKYEETENKLTRAISELDYERRESESRCVAKMNQNAIIEELLDNLKSLQSDVNERGEVLSVPVKRSNYDREEKEELLQQLAQSNLKRKATEAENDRWKRLAEERARNMVPVGRDPRTRRSLGSKVELNKLSEMQRTHNEEVHGLRSMYMTKLESLQRELTDYEEKVTLLEARILAHSAQNAQSQKRKPKHVERNSLGKRARESVNCHDLVTLLESVVPEVDVMELDGFGSEIQEVPMTLVVLKDWLKQWLEVVKIHHVQHLKKRHDRELVAFERQMRLKDERLESFRWQLVNLNSKFSKMKSDLEELKRKLDMALEEKSRAERETKMKDKELRALLKVMLQQTGEGSPDPEAMDLDQLSHHDVQQRVLVFLKKELNNAKRKLGKAEAEYQKALLEIAMDSEEEPKLKGQMLAAVEAKLTQLRNDEKCFTPTRTPEASLLAAVPNKVYTIAVVEAQEVDVKNAISSACNEVEKLAHKIAGVRKQMAKSTDNYNNGLEDLTDQATAVSNSGRKLSMLQNAIYLEELNDTKVTLFKDSQTQLEAHVGLPMEQETLYQPRIHIEEPSTSGTNLGFPEVFEEGITFVDSNPEVNSKKQDNEDTKSLTITIDSELEEIIEEDKRTDLRTRNARKRERRKTLEEYFLDSPPETTTNQLSTTEVEISKQDPLILSFFSASVLQTTEKNTLTASTSSPQQENVIPKLPSPFASPLFDKIKSRRREFNKTREDIQVLGLALEVRKIEKQLLQIDSNRASMLDATTTAKTRSFVFKVSSGRLNKQYTILTGKVGHFAKQMGLTSAEKQMDTITYNPLFNNMTIPPELVSLQQRVEAVAQSLASIEAKAIEYLPNTIDQNQQHTSYSKECLLDIVKAHFSQVQQSLSAHVVLLSP